MKRGGIMGARRAVGNAGADARADEDAGLLVDTLYALTRAIAATSANLRALRAFGSGAKLDGGAAHSTRNPGPREHSRS